MNELTDSPFFSVIIPCYNSGRTIIPTLNSVINQTYKDFEIVVIDDGSEDGSGELIKNFFLNRDVRFRYFRQANSGPAKARNEGVRKATGKYVAFLDADDCWHPQKLEVVFNVVSRDAVPCLAHKATLDQDILNKRLLPESFELMRVSFPMILLKNFATTPSVVIKRENFLWFNEKMRFAEDHDLWLRTAFSYGLYKLKMPLVVLNRLPLTSGGLSASRWNMRKGEIKMYWNLKELNRAFMVIFPFLALFSLAMYIKTLAVGDVRHFLRTFMEKRRKS